MSLRKPYLLLHLAFGASLLNSPPRTRGAVGRKLPLGALCNSLVCGPFQ